MRKFPILPLLFMGASLLAAPSTYNIPKLPDGFEPTIDGDLSDWAGNPAYLLDSIRSDANVFVETPPSEPWTRTDFQFYLYAAWNNQKLFFAIKVVADDVYRICNTGTTRCDNIKFNIPGKATAFYIYPDGTYKPNPSCPWSRGTTLWLAANPVGNAGERPTYEWALSRSVPEIAGDTSFQFSIGTEEVDDSMTCSGGASGTYNCYDMTFVAVGVDGPVDKHDYNSSVWDNAAYWPTFKLAPPAANPTQTHVFWYKCIQNNYALQDSPGPNIKGPVTKHEGMIVSAALNQRNNAQDPLFIIGSGSDDAQGRCGFFWIKDLCQAVGRATKATIRAEFRDGFNAGAPWCQPGPITFRCGVLDFAGNIASYSSIDSVSAAATWSDALYPLAYKMGFNPENTASMMQEETLTIIAPVGRFDPDLSSLLEKRFFELNVTNQVNWILSNTGANKGSFSGQYAIACLVPVNQGNYGKINTYSHEACILPIGSISPWTQDGNTMHLVVESDNLQFASSETNRLSSSLPGIGRIYPNPFKSAITIEFDAAANPNSVLSIYSLDGKKVFTTATNRTGAIVWSPKNLASGIYICRMKSGIQNYSKSILLSR